MTEKILFIGAGASCGARPKNPPPMGGSQLTEWLKNQCQFILKQFNQEPYIYDPSRVLNIFKDAEKIFSSNLYMHIKDYEDLLKEFVKNNEYGNLYVFQMIIVLLFSAGRGKNPIQNNCFQKQKDLYDDLIEIKNINSSWVAISQNYDLLLEEAVERKGFIPQYHGFYSDIADKEDIKIFKPHGSINFSSSPDIRFSSSMLVDTPIPTRFEHITYMLSKKESSSSIEYNDYAVEYPHLNAGLSYIDFFFHADFMNAKTIMANYMEGKYSKANFNLLETIRRAAINHISSNSEILIIGVKPIFDDKDDPFAAKFMAKLEKINLLDGSITYVGFDSKYGRTDENELIRRGNLSFREKILQSKHYTDCEKMKIKFGTKVKIYSDGLEDYIKKIRSEVSKNSQVSKRTQRYCGSPAALSPM